MSASQSTSGALPRALPASCGSASVGQRRQVGRPVAPRGVRRHQLGRALGVGEHEDGLDPALVLGVGVAEVGQDAREVGDDRVEPGDDVEGRPDVEAAHAVLGRPRRVGELAPGLLLLAGGGRLRVAGRDRLR